MLTNKQLEQMVSINPTLINDWGFIYQLISNLEVNSDNYFDFRKCRRELSRRAFNDQDELLGDKLEPYKFTRNGVTRYKFGCHQLEDDGVNSLWLVSKVSKHYDFKKIMAYYPHIFDNKNMYTYSYEHKVMCLRNEDVGMLSNPEFKYSLKSLSEFGDLEDGKLK